MKSKIILICSILLVSFNAVALAKKAPAPPVPVFTEEKTNIVVTKDQPQFTLELKSNPTTGYSWFLREYDDNFLVPVSHAFVASAEKNLVGAPGHEVWTFRVKPTAFTVPQQTTVRLIYTRPWQNESATQVVFRVTTQTKQQ